VLVRLDVQKSKITKRGAAEVLIDATSTHGHGQTVGHPQSPERRHNGTEAQMELTNPEKSLTGTLPGNRPDEAGRTFRYASLSSGLDIVRKVLGQHAIATVQTTAIDRTARAVSLTTVLIHASGEWIASDWPVCGLSEMATPRRMGAALTYARRYALFTLVGIAGEDDLDAPDLAGQPAEGAHKAGNGLDQTKKLNGSSTPGPAAGNLSAFAKSRKPWTPPKQTLAPEASATLRDRLLSEFSGLSSVDEATAWAQRALGTKNSLTDVDAAAVEAAFASRMAELGDGVESPLPSPPEAGESPAESREPPGRAELMAALRASAGLDATHAVPPPEASRLEQPEAPPVKNAVVWHIDKSALPLSEPRRYRDRAHLKLVASQPCLRCGRQPSEPHHLRFMQPRALGRKVSDEFAVPLCRTHHREIHRHGDEAAWWKSAGIDPAAVAHGLWQHSRLNGAPIQEHVDPLLRQAPAPRGDDTPASPFLLPRSRG
jgi:hypothetical protein